MKPFWYVIGLVAMSCSSNPNVPKSTPVIPPKGPSDEEYLSYDSAHGVIFTKGRDGQTHRWKFKSVETTGEEKFVFERDVNFNDSLLAFKGPPTISFGKAFEGHEAFEGVFQNFGAESQRLETFVATNGFPPFGVSNDLYFGHVFWDMDAWMVPAMVFIAPQTAKAAAQYRLDRADQAHINYVQWGKERGGKFEQQGMKFPWESSVTGKEVCVQKTKNQEHISGDVVWGLTQSEAMGLVDPVKVKKVAKGVSTYYLARSVKTKLGYELRDVTSPNEKFEGDNDLYTNLLAQWVMNERSWNEKIKFHVPSDSTSLLNYDGDPLKDYQQAAGLLAIYPLQAPVAEANARAMMDRFAHKISPSGPAMGQAVVATIWARLGEPDKAYTAWMDSWKPFLKGSSNLFSERRNAVRPYFYTGAAGAIDTVLYGFIGLRIDRIPLPGAKWTQRLKSGWWLSAKPCVPEQLGTIAILGLTIEGKLVDVKADSKGNFSIVPATH